MPSIRVFLCFIQIRTINQQVKSLVLDVVSVKNQESLKISNTDSYEQFIILIR